jgi:hypothetical protein
MFFIPWLAVAILVWMAALVMYCTGQAIARPLAFAMAATFPAVFLFQIIAAVLDVVILLTFGWAKSRMSIDDTLSSLVLVQTVIAPLFLSAIGFYEGWHVGWACGKGTRFRDAILERSSVSLGLRLCRLPFLFQNR